MSKGSSFEATIYTPSYNIWIHAEWNINGCLTLLTPIEIIPSYIHDSGVPQTLIRTLLDNMEMVFSGKKPTMLITPPKSQFDECVRDAMWQIPPGKPITYGMLAMQINRPGGAQAVGQACARNPMALLIPCHRITAQHSLGGYRWGLPIKQKLLNIEAGIVNQGERFPIPAIVQDHPEQPFGD